MMFGYLELTVMFHILFSPLSNNMKYFFLIPLHAVILFSLSACLAPSSTASLKGTPWNLVQIKGLNSITLDNQAPAHIVFHHNANSLHGSNGCVGLRAHYIKKDEYFYFTKIKNMPCRENNQQAIMFNLVLQQTNVLK